MSLWLRLTLAGLSGAGGFALAILIETPVKRAMLRASRGKVGRALVVTVLYYVAILVAAFGVGFIASVVYQKGYVAAMVIVMAIGLLMISPFCYIYMSTVSLYTGSGALTERADLQRRGADRKVARAIAWPGMILSWLVLTVILSYGIVMIGV